MPKKVRPITKKKFEDTHVRMTTYLKKSLRQKLEVLKDEKIIASYTRIINTALTHYLKEHL